MKVLHVIIGLDIGGAELAMRRLVLKGHAKDGVQHQVVSLTTLGTIGPQLKSLGVEVHAMGLNGPLGIPVVILRLMRFMRSERPDIVQTWMYHADLLGGVAARLAGCRRVIWGIRTTELQVAGGRATSYVRTLCAWLSSYVPKAIVCVAHSASRSHVALGYAAARMVVIPNGFDLSSMKATSNQRVAARVEFGWNDDHIVIGFVGRFHVDKGQLNFVQSAAILARQYSNVRFLMVGRNLDEANAQLSEWIAATGVPDRFLLLGERQDLPICYAAMDIFCLASCREAFPNVVGEAMAMGLPCIVTDVGDAAVLVGNAGLVVPKEDSAALAGGLGEMIEMSEADRRDLGQMAKKRIVEEFSMESCMQRFATLYADVVKPERF